MWRQGRWGAMEGGEDIEEMKNLKFKMNTIEKLSHELGESARGLQAKADRFKTIKQTVVINERDTKVSTELAQRICNVLENDSTAQGRVIVKYKSRPAWGQQPEEFIYIVTPAAAFQFRPTDPEVIEVDDFKNSYLGGCLKLVAEAQTKAKEAEEEAASARQSKECLQEEFRRLERQTEKFEQTIPELRQQIGALEARIEIYKDDMRTLLKKWNKLTPRGCKRVLQKIVNLKF